VFIRVQIIRVRMFENMFLGRIFDARGKNQWKSGRSYVKKIFVISIN